MRVLVTGAGGFVGRAVMRQLADRHEAIGIDTSSDGQPDIQGDLRHPDMQQQLIALRPDAVIHLATVPGGAAEADPELAWQVNVEATRALFNALAAQPQPVRLVFASSIAVFGLPPTERLSDVTPVAPDMLYGAHKAMMETWLAALTRRGAIAGLALRLPGIVARPVAPSGLKSAFLSNLFHALRLRQPIELPVAPAAATLLMSVERAAWNIVHSLDCDATGSLTLPALHVRMSELVRFVAEATGADRALVSWKPDPDIEARFGRYPPLTAARASSLGFAVDPGLGALVRSAYEALGNSASFM
jgi:nucleoside-diphosphate-sugar epimerase